MQCYHLEVGCIPEYINMIEDAQRQAGRAGRAISDDTLLLFASTAMLTSERFPQDNYAWEDQAEPDKTWAAWNLLTSKPTPRRESRLRPTGATLSLGWPIQPPAQKTSFLLTIRMREAAETSKP